MPLTLLHSAAMFRNAHVPITYATSHGIATQNGIDMRQLDLHGVSWKEMIGSGMAVLSVLYKLVVVWGLVVVEGLPECHRLYTIVIVDGSGSSQTFLFRLMTQS
jgi:hypothetical protein